MASSDQNQVISKKVAITASLVLCGYGNVRYLVGRSGDGSGDAFHVGDNPFTANMVVILVYWIVLHLLQAYYIIRVLFPAEELTGAHADAVQKHGQHFIIFNVLHFVWVYLFAKSHYFWSEVIILVNFFNVLVLYFGHKTVNIRPWANWILIHLPVSALPISWLFYAIFWNGAVLFHVHKFVGRVVSNVLIWDFLLVPGAFLFLYNDHGVGFSSSVLVFGIGLAQLFTKLFALQWIFAFIIAAMLLVFSIAAGLTGSLRNQGSALSDQEAAPLIQS